MVCLGSSRIWNRKEIAVFDFSRNLSFFFLQKHNVKLEKHLKTGGYTNVTELDNHAIFSDSIKRKMENIFFDFSLLKITKGTKLGKMIHFSNSCLLNLWPLFLIVLIANRSHS
jgi:hypothetical protein